MPLDRWDQASTGMLQKVVWGADFRTFKTVAIWTTSEVEVCGLDCMTKYSDFKVFHKASESWGRAQYHQRKQPRNEARVTEAAISSCKHRKNTREKVDCLAKIAEKSRPATPSRDQQEFRECCTNLRVSVPNTVQDKCTPHPDASWGRNWNSKGH